MVNQPNITAMAFEFQKIALFSAFWDGHRDLDQFVQAKKHLAEWWNEAQFAAHSTQCPVKIELHRRQMKALCRAKKILSYKETRYIAQMLAAVTGAPIQTPHKGAG